MASNFSQGYVSQMVAYLRTALSQAPQRWSICSTRSISSSSILRKERPSRADEDGDEEGGRRAVSKDPSWKEWAGTVGKQFAESHRPRNWLGNQVVESVCRSSRLMRYGLANMLHVAISVEPIVSASYSGLGVYSQHYVQTIHGEPRDELSPKSRLSVPSQYQASRGHPKVERPGGPLDQGS